MTFFPNGATTCRMLVLFFFLRAGQPSTAFGDAQELCYSYIFPAFGKRHRVREKMEYNVRAGADLPCAKIISHILALGFFSSCRQSAAFSVQCEQAARTCPLMTSRSRMCPVSDHLRSLALLCHLSASAASRNVLALVALVARAWFMASLLVSSLCVRVISGSALWLCLQTCLAGAGLELGTLLSN